MKEERERQRKNEPVCVAEHGNAHPHFKWWWCQWRRRLATCDCLVVVALLLRPWRYNKKCHCAQPLPRDAVTRALVMITLAVVVV